MLSLSVLLYSAGVLFFSEYLRKKFPRQYDAFMTEFYFNTIFLYTQCQITIKNGYNKLKKEYPFINDKIKLYYAKINSFFPKPKEYIFEFIKDGKVVVNFTEEEILNDDFNFPNDTSYDFYIFSNYKNAVNECVEKIIGRNICNSFEIATASSVKLLLSEITIGESKKTMKISFSTDKYNYLMVNNIIDEQFIRYFMKKHYNEDLCNQHAQSYTLKLMDGDVNLKIFNNTNKLVILDASYKSIDDHINTAYNEKDIISTKLADPVKFSEDVLPNKKIAEPEPEPEPNADPDPESEPEPEIQYESDIEYEPDDDEN